MTTSTLLRLPQELVAIDEPVALDQGRVDAVLAAVHEAGSKDTRFLARAKAWRLGTSAAAGASALVAVVGAPSGPWLGVAGLVAAAMARLWVDGRADVAQRRMRWLLDAVGECDRQRGALRTDEVLAGVRGDVLAAVASLRTAAQLDLAESAPELPPTAPAA